MLTLKHRSYEPEIMDDLTISSDEMRQTLNELEVINNWLGGHKVILDALDKLVAKHKPHLLRIADIGCGGGDTLKNIARWARRKGVKVELVGVDANNFIVQYARRHCGDFPEIQVELHDVFSEEFAREQYDVVVCSLFCHHFTDEQLVRMFRQLHQQAQLAVIINDLHRHWLAYYSIKYLTAVFSKSPMVQNDGPLSVWRAFKRPDLERLVREAGISTYKLRWMWAFRWQLLLLKP